MSMEDALVGVRDYVQSQFATKKAAIEAARGVSIPNYQELSLGPSVSQQYPLIEIIPDSDVPSYSSDDQPYAEGWMFHGVVVTIAHEGSNPKQVANDVMRYAEIIEKMVDDDDTFGGRFLDVRKSRIDYAPMMQDTKSGKMLQVAVFPLVIKEAFAGA